MRANEKEFELIRKNLKVDLLANMTEFGKSKLLSANELENLGYNIVIYPVTTQRLAMKSVEDGLRTIMNDGHQNNIIDKMQTRKRLYELVDYDKYNTPDKKITDFKTDEHELFMSKDIKKGLLGIVVDETTISQVMPDIYSLTYRGYAVLDLCKKCIFEEVAYLVLNGDLPNKNQLNKFKKQLEKNRNITINLREIIKHMPKKITSYGCR